VVCVQLGPFSQLALGGVVPDLALLIVVAAAIARGPSYGALLGFAAGLTLDVAPPADHTMGRWALALAVVGYLAGQVRDDADHSVIAAALAGWGVARNGLFLELHRLLDTLFRLHLEEHPDATPELAAQAFSTADTLPAPQVVRELNRLGCPLTTQEIRNLYKHMNAVRNNMAHEAVIARVIISRTNSKRMAQLANMVADVLDAERNGLPGAVEPFTVEEDGYEESGQRRAVWLIVGIGWSWFESRNVPLLAAFAVTGLVAWMVLVYGNRLRS